MRQILRHHVLGPNKILAVLMRIMIQQRMVVLLARQCHLGFESRLLPDEFPELCLQLRTIRRHVGWRTLNDTLAIHALSCQQDTRCRDHNPLIYSDGMSDVPPTKAGTYRSRYRTLSREPKRLGSLVVDISAPCLVSDAPSVPNSPTTDSRSECVQSDVGTGILISKT